MNTDRTANANLAPRCQHTKMNGQPCCAPARRNRKYCVFHEAAHARRPDYQVRLVEDAMSLQVALFQVMRALDDHSIDTKRAALKLYALQIAASNLKRLQQEIDYVPADDPAREKSLVELLLDQLQVPWKEYEDEHDAASAGYGPPPIADFDESPSCQPPATIYQPQATTDNRTTDDPRPRTDDHFDINACTDPGASSSTASVFSAGMKLSETGMASRRLSLPALTKCLTAPPRLRKLRPPLRPGAAHGPRGSQLWHRFHDQTVTYCSDLPA